MKTWTSILAAGALLAGAAGVQAANAGVVLSDDFNADAQTLNWTGDSTFNSTGAPASTDLIGTGFFDFYPGNGNYVDLDGSTGSGNNPAGQLTSVASLAAGTYTLTFDLGGNARGVAAQTTDIALGSTSIASLTLGSSDPLANHSFTFTTTGGNLVFTEEGPSDQQGNILDNVVLSTAVPEPATWAVMLMGFGGMGAAMRRRRAIAAAA